MAKLAQVAAQRTFPSSIDGIFIRDIPMKKAQTLFAGMDGEDEAKLHETVVKVFREVLCGADGTSFEEFQDPNLTFDQLSEIISVNLIWTLMNEDVPAVMIPKGVDVGEHAAAGTNK